MHNVNYDMHISQKQRLCHLKVIACDMNINRCYACVVLYSWEKPFSFNRTLSDQHQETMHS